LNEPSESEDISAKVYKIRHPAAAQTMFKNRRFDREISIPNRKIENDLKSKLSKSKSKVSFAKSLTAKKLKARKVEYFESETSLIKIVKKDSRLKSQMKRRSNFSAIESKVKKYISGNNAQKEVQIRGIYSTDHFDKIEKISSENSKRILKRYFRFSFEKPKNSEEILLTVKNNDKILFEEESNIESDQGTQALPVENKENSHDLTAIGAQYRLIDNYLEDLKSKGIGIFQYFFNEKFDEKSSISYECYSIQDFYKMKMKLKEEIYDKENQSMLSRINSSHNPLFRVYLHEIR